MMNFYKTTKNPPGLFKGWISALAIAFSLFSMQTVSGQCIRTTPFGTVTVSDQTTQAVNISTCVFTNEYSTVNVNDPGQYEFAILGAPTYLTVTDASNNVIDHGPSPLTVNIATTGAYRFHYAEDASCASVSACRTSTVQYVGPLGAGTISVQIGFGTTAIRTSYVPAYRFSATSANRFGRSLAIYTEAELIAAGITPGTTIESIGYQKDNGGTVAGKDLELKIWMRTGSLTAPIASTPWADCIAGSTLVFDRNDIQFADTDPWVDFDFNIAPFIYTGGTLEIAFENQITATTSPYGTDRWDWVYDDNFGTQHVIGNITNLSTFSTANLSISTLYSFRPNTRFEISAPTGTDAALSEFVNPVAACPGSTPVSVVLLNSGSEPVDTATIGWTLNGVAQTPVTWTGSIGTGDTAHVNLGSFTSVAGTSYDIVAFINSVGPGLDTNTINDTASFMGYRAALDGTFTVDAGSPASATNFQSLVDVADALNSAGVCGPVVFNVAANSGPYVGRVEFGEIAGTSAINTITINGNGNLLSNTAANTNDRAALMLNGTDYMTIDSLNIEAEGTWAWGIQLMNEADHNTIKNCRVEVPTTSTSTFFSNVVMSGSATSATTTGSSGSFNTFENNVHVGGYYTYTMMGASATNRSQNNKIINCVMEDMALYGVYCSQQEGTEVVGCDISRATRTNGSTFYGIFFTSSVPAEVSGNRVHDIANNFSTTAGAYAYYFSSSGGNSAANPLKFHNNAAYNLNNNGLQYAVYMLGATNNVEFYHNSIILVNPVQTGASTLACFYHTGATNNFDMKNNIFHIDNGNTGTQYNIWFSNAGANFTSNNNVLYNSDPNGITARLGTTNYNTLADWQLVNSGAYDQNSEGLNPVFDDLANGVIAPLSGSIDNIGVPVGVTTDINGATRSTTTPDAGAVEFVGVAADLALAELEIFRGECFSNSDTIAVTIHNVIGPAVNLAADTVVVHWEVTGPVTSTGTVIFNSGTLPSDATLTGISTGVDMSQAGMYSISAWLDSSAVNLVGFNDTISGQQFEVRPIISVSPQSVTIGNPNDSLEISVNSPFMPGGGFFITEISHFRGSSTGAPVGGWPSYLIADDYIEITGVPNSDLGGFTLEVWTTTAQNTDYTFPPGTLLSPNGTCIVATGQLGSSQPSPSDFYYHGNGTFTGLYGSATSIGYIIKDASGTIVDACAYSAGTAYTFPAAASVSSADWSGATASGSGTAGVRLEGAYTKDATNWIVSSSTNPQNPNLVNNLVTVPTPGNLTGLEWSFQGTVIDTVPNIFVGPWPTPGTYYYVATYQSPCGPLTDSVEVIVDFPFCFDPDSLMVDPACTEAEVSWQSGVLTNSSTLEYGPAGFTQGTGTIVSGATSPYLITGLSQLTDYDVYVMDSCAGWLSGAVAFDSTLAGSVVSDFNISPTTSSVSSCPGNLSVTIPAGATIDSVSVEYAITAASSAWMSEQRSFVVCTSPGGIAEPMVYSGVGTTVGTFSYNRSGLNIANGVTGGGTINFQLHNFRTFGGSGCDPIFNTVDAGTFKVTVFTQDSVFTQIGESMAMETFTTLQAPIAAGIDVNDNGNGNYDFSADTASVGTISWDFGDGNSANGDSVNHTYAAPGTYTVTMIAENACGSDTATVTVNFISVDEFGFTSINIFPNPTAGAFVIDNLPQEGGDIVIRINDMQGRTVVSKVLNQGQQQRLEMDLRNLRSGTYFLNISNDAGTITKPVVLNK